MSPTIHVYTSDSPARALAELNRFFSRFGCGREDGRGALAEALRDILTGELIVIGYLSDEQSAWFTEWLRARAAEIEPRTARDIAIAEAALQVADAIEK